MIRRDLHLIPALFFLLAALLLAVVPAASPRDQEESGQPLAVFVSIAPQAWMVERIGREQVEVRVLVEPGQSPATYAVSPGRMAALARSRVFFRIGVPFEKVLVPKLRAAAPDLPVVSLAEEADLEAPRPGHAHGDQDPHTWLDPRLLLAQAGRVCQTLSSLRPASARFFARNLRSLELELDALDARVRAQLAPHEGRTIYVFHPAYAYFCRAYGLRQRAVAPGGTAPSGKALARLIEEMRAAGARAIFVQPQFSSKTAATLARAVGARLVELDPLARNYADNLEHMARVIARELESRPLSPHGEQRP